MDFGQRIKQVRTDRGVSQTHICLALNRSTGWLSNIETGRRSISASELEKIAGVMGVSLAIFFTNTPPTKASE